MPHYLKITKRVVDDIYHAHIEGFPITARPPFIWDARYEPDQVCSPPKQSETYSISADSVDGLESALQDFQASVKELNELAETRANLRTQLLKNVLLSSSPNPQINVDYSGYSDSGQIENVDIPDDTDDLSNDVGEFLWDMMWKLHSGFNNNEGGQGNITWHLDTDKIVISHDENIMTTSNTTTEV